MRIYWLVPVLLIFFSGCIAPEQKEKPAERVEIQGDIEENCLGFLVGSPEEMRTARLAGAGWVRPHPGPFAWGRIEPSRGDFDFGITDRWVKEAQQNNVAILATIWPYADWDQQTCHALDCAVSERDQFYPRGDHGIPKYRCRPCNMSAYRMFLRKLVERYDGDGIDDMPGLKIPVKYWEILNEPEMQEYDMVFFKGTPEDYVDILKASYEAIKEACADCKVVQGGAAGAGEKTSRFWTRVFELNGTAYFDIANIHYITHGDLRTLNVEEFRQLLNEEKPIWVTEAQLESEDEVEYAFRGAFSAGAEKVFSVSFVAGKMGPPVPGVYSPVFREIVNECDAYK